MKKIKVSALSLLLALGALSGCGTSLTSEDSIDSGEPIVSDQYNLYVTLGTLPTLYAGLEMFAQEVESYAWYFRSGTFDRELMPSYVNYFETQGVDNANSTLDFSVIRDKVVELKELAPNAKFHLYTDDLRVQFVLDLLIGAGLEEDDFLVTLLSDGTGTYSVFNRISDEDWGNMQVNWDTHVEHYQGGSQFKWGDNNQAMYLQNYAAYVSTFANVEYWLQYPEYMQNEEATTLMADKEAMHLIAKDPHAMYSALDALQKEQFEKAVLSSSNSTIEFYNQQFLDRDRDILIIAGTNKPGLETNVEYIDQALADFADTHYIYFKPHPAYPPNEELEGYFDDHDIITLPYRTPMEAILWMFPDVFVGGYSSSLFMSTTPGQTLFFFGELGTPLPDLEALGHFDNAIKYELPLDEETSIS